MAAVNNLDNDKFIEHNIKNRRGIEEANITVFHVAGTEKENGLSKGQIINEAIKRELITTNKFFSANRLMDDANSLLIVPDYADNSKPFYDKLFEIYNKVQNNKTGGGRSNA